MDEPNANASQPEATEEEQELAQTERMVEEENQRYPDFAEPDKRREGTSLPPEGTKDPTRAGRDHPDSNSEPFTVGGADDND